MLYAFIIYFISISIWGLNNYILRADLSKWNIIAHLLITFIYFEYYFINFRLMLWNFINYGFDSFQSQGQTYAFNEPIDFLLSVLFFLISFFVSGLALNIAVKAKSRKLLLISSPFIVLITTLDLFKIGVVKFELAAETKLFIVLLIFVSTIFGAINLFYNIKPGKNIFILSQHNLPVS